MNNPYKVKSAILFMVFNRPDPTYIVLEEIRKARPSRLYIAADGPRLDRSDESQVIDRMRSVILGSIDWRCEIKTLFRSRNLGCKLAVSSAIDWFFSNEEEGIVLEDDCLPSNSFFQFCDEMLAKYRQNKSVGMIAGSNLLNNFADLEADYFFSKYVLIWGWATWRDRWSGIYDVDMKLWPKAKLLGDGWLYGDQEEVDVWSAIFESVYKGEISTWDYQWVFANWINKKISIIPRENLISNIGFGRGATHTIRKTSVANLPKKTINFPIRHPELQLRNIEADKEFYRRHIYTSHPTKILKIIYKKIKQILAQ